MSETVGDHFAFIIDSVVHTGPAIARICAEVWREAEISKLEINSAEIHIRELEAAGFTIVSRGASGYDTAFIAEWRQGEDGPIIGFLSEYDALPNLGNAPVPEQALREDGVTNGHGCGHNLLGAGCTGAAIALKVVMEQQSVAGTLRVYGCAAEETHGVKVFMARDGLFDDTDACLAWHSGPIPAVGQIKSAAQNSVVVEFFGRTAHAGFAPWDGRSALDAAELFTHALNLMREHIVPTARIHYIYESAGTAINVVPDYARVGLALRDKDRASVEAYTEWARQAADGAALATQTQASVRVVYGMWDLLPNRPLVERIHTHMMRVGMPKWTMEEQNFARACQAALSVPEIGLATDAPALAGVLTVGGSTDVADVSWNAPTGVFMMPTLPQGIGLHTWPVTACGGMSIGVKGTMAAAAIMATTGYDLLTDAALREAVRADFVQRKGDRRYVAAVASGQGLVDSGAPKDGHDEFVIE